MSTFVSLSIGIIQILAAHTVVLSATKLATASDLVPDSGQSIHPDSFGGYRISGSEMVFAVELGAFADGLQSVNSGRALQRAVAKWLSSEFGLPLIDEAPAIVFAPAHRIARLRYRDAPSASSGNSSGEQPDVVAVCDDKTRTIYLPEGWSGDTPGEVSVLVHELVHHIQNVAGLTFSCPEEREKAAFQAQQWWLGLFDSDLQAEFALDPMTLLVRTNCLH